MNITPNEWDDLLTGRTSFLGTVSDHPLVFPGSFNPVHNGHQQMAIIASEILGKTVHPEISIANVDKPTLDFDTISHRVTATQHLGPTILTLAPKFVDKAALFRRATFVIGADTALRLNHIRYYKNNPSLRDNAITRIRDFGARFLVFGRKVENKFRDASELHLEPHLRELCQFVPSTRFRVDISSSELRTQND